MQGDLGTPIHDFGDWLRAALQSIPLTTVRGAFLAFLLIAWLGVLLAPAPQREADEERPARWDGKLKLWASLALFVQIVIYLVF
jgi:hypothetical protein